MSQPIGAPERLVIIGNGFDLKCGLHSTFGEYIKQVADDNDIVIEKMEVMPDHIHMLISFPPSKAPASAIKALKGRSAYIFLQNHPEIRCSQYWGGHLWSPSYHMSTLGNMSKEVVEKYINDQEYTETNKKPHKGAQ